MIPHSRPTISGHDMRALIATLESGMIGQGAKGKELETLLAQEHGMAGAVMTNSGTNAIQLALQTLGASGGEVILPSYICASVLDAVYASGATPVLADNTQGHALSAEDIAQKLSKRTRAVLVAHLFGDPVDLEGVRSLGVPVIEDCAQAIGATYAGNVVGSQGDYSVFSFGPTKVITGGQGGAALAKDPDAVERMRKAIANGNRDTYHLASSFGLSDIASGLILSQHERLADLINRRHTIAARYDDALGERAPQAPQGSIRYRYVVDFPNADQAVDAFKERGVSAERPVYMPLHRILNESSASFPGAEASFAHAVSIPIYPSLDESQIDKIAKTLKEVASRYAMTP